MSTLAGLLIGFAGTGTAYVLAAVLWSDWGCKRLPTWVDSFPMLLLVLVINVSGWIVAVTA